MKLTNLMTLYRRLLLLPVFMLAALAGCVKEDMGQQATQGGDPVAILLSMPGTTVLNRASEAVVTDESVARVRVFAFDRSDIGRKVLNTLVDSPSDPFWFHLPAGSYDFYFVVNEPTDKSDFLNSISIREQLKNFHMETDMLVSDEGLYVMSAVQTDVLVEPDHSRPREEDGHFNATITYTDADGLHAKSHTLNVSAYRLATKVQLKLVRKKDDQLITYDDIENEPKITGLPASVPMIAGVYSRQPATAEVELERATLPSYENNGADFDGYRAIIPSYAFAPADGEQGKALAARLNVKLKNEADIRTMPLGHSLSKETQIIPVDYTLHRNTRYKITGNVGDDFKLDILVLDWDEQNTEVTLGYRATNLGQPGCENNLSANGETFTLTIYQPFTESSTKGRIRYNLDADKGVIYEFNIPASDANGKTTFTLTMPQMTPTSSPAAKYADNKDIVMEIKAGTGWKTLLKGTLWPPEFLAPVGTGGVSKNALVWARKEMTGAHDDGSAVAACADYWTIHPLHSKSGKGKWVTPTFEWANSGDMYPLYHYAVTSAPFGDDALYGEPLSKERLFYFTNSAHLSNSGSILTVNPNGTNVEWNAKSSINTSDTSWNFLTYPSRVVINLRCCRIP